MYNNDFEMEDATTALSGQANITRLKISAHFTWATDYSMLHMGY